MSDPVADTAASARVPEIHVVPTYPNLIQRMLGRLLRRDITRGRPLLGDMSVVAVAPPLRAVAVRAGLARPTAGDARAA